MIRIVGLSATLPNYRDVARFLGVGDSGAGCRLTPLRPISRPPAAHKALRSALPPAPLTCRTSLPARPPAPVPGRPVLF